MLAAFDVFVHPALAESFGLAVVEAMAMRRPVVATPVGIAGDVIEDGVSGIRIAGTDVDSLVEAMSRAVEWRDRWPELGAEARRRALDVHARALGRGRTSASTSGGSASRLPPDGL